MSIHKYYWLFVFSERNAIAKWRFFDTFIEVVNAISRGPNTFFGVDRTIALFEWDSNDFLSVITIKCNQNVLLER